ncbi:MAG: histidine kinase, partial [Gammaproteobacteria bacterium]|nr:histidine kinase [Gammaproteobacteria bacterium]
MLSDGIVLFVAFFYLALLFGIAYFGDKRSSEQRSIINNPYVYSLSLAIYCTAWTYYGSVGRAATTGLGFLPIYLGPTLMAALWWFVLRKIVRISKKHRITSIADFIGSRYGKSALLTSLVTVISVIGILPYIALQLKAVASSYTVIQHYPQIITPTLLHNAFWQDTPFYVALLLAMFTIIFGTRQLDVTEHHEGMVAAIAFESIIKLLAFLAVGIYTTFFLFSGPTDLFSQAIADPELASLLTMDALPGGYVNWFALLIISMFAIFLLPRQFQVAVVENTDESHIDTAAWLFPLYLLIINLFVLPLALGGLLLFPDGSIDPDNFVLTIPMAGQQPWLTLVVFIGGLSAANSKIIVATIALYTMICNELIMPLMVRKNILGF